MFWNHGGGSVSGAAFDELYGMDSLTLAEMDQAFVETFGENSENQPVDIIGFDTCLMATVDVAYTFSDIGKYLVASQELEPGNGWLYSGLMSALAETPDMEPLELSKVICDSYVQGCEEVGTEDNITLSVTDLSKVGNLIAAYDDFGKEALASAVDNPAFFAQFSKIANTRGDVSADALPAVPLAKRYNAPLLLTLPDSLPENVLAEIKALGAKQVIIVGGPGAVKAAVEETLKDAGLQVERVYGQTQGLESLVPNPVRYGGNTLYDTNEIVLKNLQPTPKSIYGVTGKDFADALSGAAGAAESNSWILLTGGTSNGLTMEQENLLKGMEGRVKDLHIFGGPAVVPETTLNRIKLYLGH